MNHYLMLEITPRVLQGTIYRVCPAQNPNTHDDPRWKPDKPMWDNAPLECAGKPVGEGVFDRFEIHKRAPK